MLHLIVTKEFTYLNYLSIMSAHRFNELTIWIKEEPENNPHWDIIKKLNVTFAPVDAVTGITLHYQDFTGRLDIIYMKALTSRMVDDAMIDHEDMYNVDGEFKINDMELVRVYKPELITRDYVENSNTAIANLIKHVLLERVWNAKI